jgi:hypothetical protein
MTPFCVVKHLDVIEYITTSIFPCDVNFSLDPFSLQKLEKTFCDSIIVAVTSTTHAGNQIVRLQELRQSELLYWLPWSL